MAKPALREFYQKTDPTNSFNSGIGGTSKLKNWQELSDAHKGCGCHK
jgi:D-lactate dehydrogenase